VSARRWLRPEIVDRYMEILDDLPPITVFATDEQYVVVDGLHTLAAATKLGRTEILAEVREGSFGEAREYAIRANARHGEALDSDERTDAICWLADLHPDWSHREIASTVGVSHTQVNRVLAATKVKAALAGTAVPHLTTRKLAALARADEADWAPLARTASRKRWSELQVTHAVANLTAVEAPESFKRALKMGNVAPLPQPSTADSEAVVARYPQLAPLWCAEQVQIGRTLDLLPIPAQHEFLAVVEDTDWRQRDALLKTALDMLLRVAVELATTPEKARDRINAGELDWPGIRTPPPYPIALSPAAVNETPQQRSRRKLRDEFLMHASTFRFFVIGHDAVPLGRAFAENRESREKARQIIAETRLWLDAFERALNS
jgi:ParB-like chromosome segregation protein Spo0J